MQPLSDQSIREWHASMWKPGFASVSADEAIFLRDMCRLAGARVVLEIGTASGLSSALLIKCLETVSGAQFRTIDCATTFWDGSGRQTGFLIDEHCAKTTVDARVMRGATAFDAAAVLSDRPADLIFIDANHQHPWPLIDTLLTLPNLSPSGVMVHHDLDLYRKQDRVRGIGPKYLFDQLPDVLRLRSPAAPNIFALRMPPDTIALASRIADAFLYPWSLATPLETAMCAQLERRLQQAYPRSDVAFKFSTGLARHGHSAPSRETGWRDELKRIPLVVPAVRLMRRTLARLRR